MEERIFVSYARADSDFALKLAQDLRAANVDIWIDQLDIGPGDPWDQEVEKALKACTGLLVILSPRSVASRSVMDEVSFALEQNKKTVPVIYEDCEIPFRLGRLQHTDFTSDHSNGLSKLIEALGGTPQPIDVDEAIRFINQVVEVKDLGERITKRPVRDYRH